MGNSVLIIDDSRAQRREIRRILSASGLFQGFYEAADGIEALRLALDHPADLILCDLEMPGFDGFKFLTIKNTREEVADVPVIILTGNTEGTAKIKGLEQGAHDYITKPFEPAELIARVRVHLKLKLVQDELKAANKLLLELSNTDPLTGLANRRHLMDVLTREFSRAERKKRSLSLIMADIDHFKAINDRYGHMKGDQVLVDLGRMLRNRQRPYDLAARFGGEEFAVVLPETNVSDAVRIAERIRKAAEALRFGQEMSDLALTISLGTATFPGDGIATVDDLIREADNALYRAKDEGRNRVLAA